jgi:hypothetical protein
MGLRVLRRHHIGMQHKAVELFHLFSALERSCSVPPHDGREACFIVALCQRRLRDGEMTLGRNASADMVATAALNLVCMTIRKLCVLQYRLCRGLVCVYYCLRTTVDCVLEG